MAFDVPGRPVPYTRMTQRSKHVDTAAQRYLAYRDMVGWAAVKAGVREPFTGPVLLGVKVRVSGRRGDLSNYLKGIEDGLNKIAWKDDRQVVSLSAWFQSGAWSDEGISVTVAEVGS